MILGPKGRIGILMVALIIEATCDRPSDEAVLRGTFAVPWEVKLTALDVSPKQAGWFGREGLFIKATFQFTDEQFIEYRKAAQGNALWKPLPPPKAFLMRMLGVRRYLEGLKRSYEMTDKEIPRRGSIYFPTEAQLFDQRAKLLPLNVASGLYQCKTAGDNLMYARKRPCESKDGDLNDYMFAVLDLEDKQLLIRVHTSY